MAGSELEPLDFEPRVVTPGFHGRVYAVVRQVPPGWVTTYGDVGTMLGSPRVARQVGYALAALREDDVPWHRVINAQGMISVRGDFVRGHEQRRLLEAEGVPFDAAGRMDLVRYRFRYPLR
jgi:methylated-DNA-protein-cysteine methyltransferase-like protein